MRPLESVFVVPLLVQDTPIWRTHFLEYMITHMNIDPELRKNVVAGYYPAGHMFYLDIQSLAQHKSDVEVFIKGALDT